MDRKISSFRQSDTVIDGGDMLLFRGLPVEEQVSVGPFVFLDHYRHHSRRGIGDRPHPHAGIEVISYLLDGEVEHRDSAGFRDRLGPGDAQYIRAGRGMLHAEQPAGGRHGLQLWTNLPPDQKFVEPTYKSFRAADIPRVDLPGATINVVAGKVAGATGPMVLTSKTTFALAHLQSGANATFDVDDAEELAVYVMDGALEGQGGPLGKGGFATLAPGQTVTLAATSDGPAIAALIGEKPAKGPIYFAGPFVMDSEENLQRADRDYASGKMGTLDGVPF